MPTAARKAAPHMSLGECLAAFPLPPRRPGELTLGEMKEIKRKRELAADMARAAFALDAAKARFDREPTTENQLDVRNCAEWLLRLGAE